MARAAKDIQLYFLNFVLIFYLAIFRGIQMVHFDHFDGAPPFKQFAFAKMRLWMRIQTACTAIF
jgi:hypothetical protein